MKSKVKKIVGILLTCTIILSNTLIVYAQETQLDIVDNDAYIGVTDSELTPKGVYLTTVTTRISDASNGKVYLRVEVNCVETVSSIQSVVVLQKLVNGTWTDIASKTVSTSDSYTMTKTLSASGLSSGGTYRAKSTTKVTSYTGFSETSTGYSGSIILS